MAEQWTRQPHEGGRAFAAFQAYLEAGAERTLEQVNQGNTEVIPLSTLKRWSTHWNWVERARAYDNHLVAVAQAEAEAEIRQIMQYRYANKHVRIKELDEVAAMLRMQINDVSKHYLPTKFGEQFNQGLFSEFRSTLDDIAKELGQRRQGIEHTGKDGGPIEFTEVRELSDDQLAAIAASGSAGTASS